MIDLRPVGRNVWMSGGLIVLESIVKWVALLWAGLFLGALMALVVSLAISESHKARDADGSGTHSGMTVLTDQQTGCQYLGGHYSDGGITPRMDGDGKQVGCR